MTRRYRVTVLTRSNSDPVSVQQSKDKWYRVYTGEGYVIEINASSLRFQPGRVLRVQFRTILSNPETLGGSSGEKYKTRLEAIEFKLDERRYRMSDTTLLNSAARSCNGIRRIRCENGEFSSLAELPNGFLPPHAQCLRLEPGR